MNDKGRYHTLMNFTTPLTFPDSEFRAFGIAAGNFFPGLLSDEVLHDPQEKRRHFDLAWQAVRYRYRICSECNDEFRALLDNPSDAWQSGWGDERADVTSWSGASMFSSWRAFRVRLFALCLYFLGNTIQPAAFADVANPRKITRSSTQKAMSAAFPQDAITGLLTRCRRIRGSLRLTLSGNLLAHRISGRRSVRSSGTLNKDGTYTTDFHEETWHIPGTPGKLLFDKDMLQRHLADITDLLCSFATAARTFAESHKPVKPNP